LGLAGKEVTLAIRPEHLTLQAQSDKDSQCVEGTITSKTYLGDTALVLKQAWIFPRR
jgi:ABC-type Fe3+/spermidine/putrescine transport system ATPase subunit